MNTPQESVFKNSAFLNQEYKTNGHFRIMYHGSIVERHGLDLLAKSAAMLKDRIPGLKVMVYGEGEFVPQFLEEVKKQNIEDILEYYGKVSLDEIAGAIPQIDVGVIPNRIGPFTQINFPVRVFEYLCNSKPTIVPRTQGIKDYFDEDSIFYFNADDERDLANIIYNVYSSPDNAKKVVQKGVEVYNKYQWKNQGKNLIKIYENALN